MDLWELQKERRAIVAAAVPAVAAVECRFILEGNALSLPRFDSG